MSLSALPAEPRSLFLTPSSMLSEIVVSSCCALLPKKMIELLSDRSISDINRSMRIRSAGSTDS